MYVDAIEPCRYKPALTFFPPNPHPEKTHPNDGRTNFDPSDELKKETA